MPSDIFNTSALLRHRALERPDLRLDMIRYDERGLATHLIRNSRLMRAISISADHDEGHVGLTLRHIGERVCCRPWIVPIVLHWLGAGGSVEYSSQSCQAGRPSVMSLPHCRQIESNRLPSCLRIAMQSEFGCIQTLRMTTTMRAAIYA